jgi:hypothetical protein
LAVPQQLALLAAQASPTGVHSCGVGAHALFRHDSPAQQPPASAVQKALCGRQ